MTVCLVIATIDMTFIHLAIGKRERKTPMIEETGTGEYYEFRVKDHLEEGWFRMFPGLSVKNIENGEALIFGRFANQDLVHEIFKRIQNLNLVLISMSKLDQAD